MAMSRKTHDFLPRKRKADEASSSSSSNHWRYEVFLSFRGEDTRNNFTGHLYQALKDAGVNAFIDENELTRGESITEELVRAIQGSRISIIVFSRRYAESSWCLDELMEIMKCRETLGQKVFPVFFHVDPSHVRKQTGSFAEAFHQKHKDRDEDVVKRWRDALTVAANLSGWDLRNTADGREAELIKIIIKVISEHLNKTFLHVAQHEVGIYDRMQDIISHLGVESSHDVRIVGIWGMGGIGKTTVAKALFNRFRNRFEASSFLADVRESTMQNNGQVNLQENLLSDITNRTGTKVGHVAEGITVIKNRLGCRRVFVVYDDVDRVEQLEALAIDRDSFCSGSRVIITTRDEQLLRKLGVDTIYPAQEMKDTEALELFCWHAFKSPCPEQGYRELSRSVVAFCGGLPLALKVVGSHLCNTNIAFWKDEIKKLKNVPRLEIQHTLRISYDGLNDDTEREIFLDISCFFIGENMNYVKQRLQCSHSVIDILIQRCLITVCERNRLMMHDLLKQMCSEIICAKYHDNPGEWSRIWRREDAKEVLNDESGSDKIQGLAYPYGIEISKFRTEAFAGMKRLKLLSLFSVELTGCFKYLPNKLRWLHWSNCPLEFIPRDFRLGEAVVIDLHGSKLRTVWEDSGVLVKLKILDLSYSDQLVQLPDFSNLPNLEDLILVKCTSLAVVHESIGGLNSLSLVDFRGCIKLKELPRSFYKIKSLVTLNLVDCVRFEKLDEDMGDMTSLSTLSGDNTAITKLPSSIVGLKNLRCISLSRYDVNLSLPSFPGSTTLRSYDGLQLILPHSVSGLSSVVELEICGRSLTNIPTDLGTLSSLKALNLSSTNLQSLLPRLSGLSNLEDLRLQDCNLTDDEMIHMHLESISSLKSLTLAWNSFSSLPNLQGLSKLQSLHLNNCRNLLAMPDLPTSLTELSADECTGLKIMSDFSEMSNLRKVSLRICPKIFEVPGLHQSLKKSMSRLVMDWCCNLTPAFMDKILQAWNFIGHGGILLPCASELREWLTWVNEGGRVKFQVPQIRGSNVIAFTLCLTCYHDGSMNEVFTDQPEGIWVTNHTKGISFFADSLSSVTGSFAREFLWLGNLPNHKFNLEGGDLVEIFVRRYLLKKTGVRLVWDTEETDFRMTSTDWVEQVFSYHPYRAYLDIDLNRSLSDSSAEGTFADSSDEGTYLNIDLNRSLSDSSDEA